MVLAVGASAAGAQQEENAPTLITAIEVADVRVRYLNFRWNEEAFKALERRAHFTTAGFAWPTMSSRS